MRNACSKVANFGAGLTLAAVMGAAPAAALPRGQVRPQPPAAAEGSAASRLLLRADGVGAPPSSCRPGRNVLTYHGGDLVQNPDVFLIFWGAQWQNNQAHIAAASAVQSLYQQLGSSEYACAWREYVVAGHPLGAGTYHGSEIIMKAPQNPLLDDSIRQQILDEITAGNAPQPTDDRVYVVLPPSGVPVQFGNLTGCGGSNFVFCGYHDSFRRPSDQARIRYEVLPFPCNTFGGSCFFEPSTGGSLQVVGSHELTELVTDPDDPLVAAGGWYSDRTGDENADICAGSACTTDIAISAQTFPVNPAWSNLAAACVATAPCLPPAPIACTDSTSPGECVPGLGQKHSCSFEWLVYPNLTLQKGLPGSTVTCVDGQPFCDFDGAADGQCTFHVAGCLNSTDPRGTCVPSPINTVRLAQPTARTDATNAQAILTAVSQADAGSTGTVSGSVISYSPAAATHNACTGLLNVVVPVRTLSDGRQLAGRKTISVLTQAPGSVGHAVVHLICTPAP